VKSKVLCLLLGSIALPVVAQVPTTSLVTQPIDESSLVTLRGSVHPLARVGSDRGVVPDSFSTGPMLLLLNRPADRESALQQFLQSVNTPGSASYHQWLTPEQVGQQFGPTDADLQSASAWLISHGLNVSKTSKGREFIEFSGTAGALRDAFHTEIHRYTINGETQYANATELKIPVALAPFIKGVSPLNSFRSKPALRVLGQASYSPQSHRVTPEWTIPSGNSTIYAVAPEDFATQYDLAPLYQAGVTGAGQTIGIINESNIDLSLVKAYQKLFGLAGATPQLVIDGSDPGTLPDVAVEAYLDVEQAGAVAPGAAINLYIANTNGLFTGTEPAENLVDPLYTAALRAVDDNTASVLSMSFSNCEGFLLASGNALWSGLWQQAAAQGQTVLVSSNDSGSAGCDDGTGQWITEYGLAVSGLASTPWNIAVGGTDFYYSDYATGGASAAALWNQANDAGNGSLKAPLPEQVWDTVYGLNAIGPYVQNSAESIPAGGGGASGCINSTEAGDQRRFAFRLQSRLWKCRNDHPLRLRKTRVAIGNRCSQRRRPRHS
jgi:subtilase family serine protease